LTGLKFCARDFLLTFGDFFNRASLDFGGKFFQYLLETYTPEQQQILFVELTEHSELPSSAGIK